MGQKGKKTLDFLWNGLNYTRTFFQKMLDDFEINLKMSKKELAKCPQGKLYIEMRAGKPFFFLATPYNETKKSDKSTAYAEVTAGSVVKKCIDPIETIEAVNNSNYLDSSGYDGDLKCVDDIEFQGESEATELAGAIPIRNSKPRARRSAINKDIDLIHGILRRQYLQAECNVLEKDAQLLKTLVADFIDTNPSAYTERIPKRFRIQTQAGEQTIAMIPLTSILADVTRNEDLDAWANAKYKQNPYKPELRTYITSRGLGVRSKSEQLISEKFYEFDVPFRYEQLLCIGEHSYYPDFTARNRRTGKLLYWEHFGMVNDKYYMQKRRVKLERYEAAGIVPWDNFIATYDDENGGLDMKYVEYMIKYWLL